MPTTRPVLLYSKNKQTGTQMQPSQHSILTYSICMRLLLLLMVEVIAAV
jgi:hypothetical protein